MRFMSARFNCCRQFETKSLRQTVFASLGFDEQEKR